MNKFAHLIGRTIVASLLITGTGSVLAQDLGVDSAESMKKVRHHQRGNQQMPAVTRMMRAIRHLDLSDEQKTSFKEIMRALKADERVIAKEMKAGHEQLKQLIKADRYDEQAVALVAEKEGELAAERIILASRAMSTVYAQLSDEQREQLEVMATERKARHSEKRAEKRGDWQTEG